MSSQVALRAGISCTGLLFVSSKIPSLSQKTIGNLFLYSSNAKVLFKKLTVEKCSFFSSKNHIN
jgi:hypothetical protein